MGYNKKYQKNKKLKKGNFKPKDNIQNKAIINLTKRVDNMEDEVEYKYADKYLTASVISTVANIALLNGMNQGDNASQRIGKKITCSSLQFRAELIQNPIDSTPSQVRFVILKWNPVNGVAPTEDSIWDRTVITNAIFSPYNAQYFGQYKIYYDKVFSFDPSNWAAYATVSGNSAVTSYAPRSRFFKKKIKLNFNTLYDGTSNVTADINVNGLYLMVISDSAANAPLMDFGARLYYKDS